MWTYDQASGTLTTPDGSPLCQGYSGAGEGKNNPAMQNVHDVGPIPQGTYWIEAPFNSPAHGPFAMPLNPSPSNEMFGRSGFLMHGDSLEHPGCASEGCIIMPPEVRHTVYSSGDLQLKVV